MGGWSTPRSGPFTPGKEIRYQFYWKLGVPQGRSGLMRKISPPAGIRFPERPARSVSLYRLHCPCPHCLGCPAFNACSSLSLRKITVPPPVNEFPQFVESESSLANSHQSATCPYTDKSSLLPPITFKYLF
jgi:hypothetical protein